MVVRAPSADHLREYLPEASEAISSLGHLIRGLGYDIDWIAGTESVAIPEQEIVDAMDSLASIIPRLVAGDSEA